MEQEEKAMMSTTAGANTVWKRQNERLEKRLRALNGLEAQFEENVTLSEPETLVTKLVALQFFDAMQPLSEMEYQQVKNTNEEALTIPGMLVATLKPPKRKKARVGVWKLRAGVRHEAGDFSWWTGCHSHQVIGRIGISKAWSISTADVKTAFLQAPRRMTPGRATVISPPMGLKEADILQSGNCEKMVSRWGALWTGEKSQRLGHTS